MFKLVYKDQVIHTTKTFEEAEEYIDFLHSITEDPTPIFDEIDIVEVQDAGDLLQ